MVTYDLYGPVGDLWYLWSHIVLYGPVWSHIVQYGAVWSHMLPYGLTLCLIFQYGLVWSFENLFVCKPDNSKLQIKNHFFIQTLPV